MAMNHFTRRKFLAALGGAGLSMPFFRMLESSVAEAQTPQPLRLIIMLSPHGKVPELWDPQGDETDFSITYPNAILAPLDKFRDKLLVPLGVDLRVLYEKGETGHQGGPCSVITGTRAVQRNGDLYAEGPSLDQALAEQFGGMTKFRSVQLGVNSGSGQTSFDSFVFADGGKRLPGIDDPASAYARLFADLVPADSGGSAAQRRIAQKLSVIDSVKSDIDRMNQRLAGPEKQKLEAHLAALRDIESRIGLSAPISCDKPSQPTRAGRGVDQIPVVGQSQLDLIAQSVACDLSRFYVMQWLYAGDSSAMPWLGINKNTHDDVAHMIEDGQEHRLELGKIQNWYASQLAYLMEKLSLIPEGDGTALDNTIILWANELGNPAVHDNMDQPFVVAGGCGGKFRMGRVVRFHIQSPNDTVTKSAWASMTPHNRLLVTIAQAFGWQQDYFNDPDYSGALSEFV